jgi:tetratricopeptide (TPR) repeat protein
MNLINTKLKDLILIFLTLVLFYAQFHLKHTHIKPAVTISKQEAVLNLNENVYRYFSLGQERLISSIIWVHTLMESDIEHYKGDDLNSWMYLRFNTITMLDPYFYDAYVVGGKYLSVVKDDIYGAMDIFEKGLSFFPNDFWLSLHNGFNYFFELGDLENAMINYKVAIKDPLATVHAPYLPSMVARLSASGDRLNEAFELLLPLYLKEPDDSPFKEHQEKTLYSLKAEIDLSCLNNNLTHCGLVDFRGSPYVKKNNIYYAVDEWIPARITRRGIRGTPLGSPGKEN